MAAVNPYNSPKSPAGRLGSDLAGSRWSWWKTEFEVSQDVEGEISSFYAHLSAHYRNSRPAAEVAEESPPSRLAVRRGTLMGTVFGPLHWTRHRISVRLSAHQHQIRVRWRFSIRLLCGIVLPNNPLVVECRKLVETFEAEARRP